MSLPLVELRHVAYTGAKVPTAQLDFKSGLNVVFGASNTGKSFTLKSIDCMLGSERPFPNPKLRQGYDSVWLGLEFAGANSQTLFRAATGGDFLLYEGLVTEESGAALNVDVNDFLLGACGLAGKKVIDTAEGHKQSLTIRTLAPFLIVSEKAIMDETSPIHSGQYQSVTAEKNIFRLLLTGTDDSKVVPLEPKKGKRARTAAKLEVLDDLITKVETKLGDRLPQRHQFVDQLERLNQTLDGVSHRVRTVQGQLDLFSSQRRDAVIRRSSQSARLRELDITIERFKWLLETYTADTDRLKALEEGSELLAVRAGRPCSLCGAEAEYQPHPQAGATIAQVRDAAGGELRRLRRDHRDLEATIASLAAEAGGVKVAIDDLRQEVARFDTEIELLRPSEAAMRADFEEKWNLRSELVATLRLFDERDDLLEKKVEIERASKKRAVPGTKLVQGIDGPTGHAFAKTVQDVLTAWKFPGTPNVSFDDSTQDIRINGVDRRDNGKGVRAILHAAFKVALIVYCKERGLPHPGFLLLDTPLLTYRDPLASRHGELAADEEQLKESPLKRAFYEHLLSLTYAQIIILENDAPPDFVFRQGNVQVFEGAGAEGRVGFFPST